MADNLEIFGETYSNATGIKAKNTGGTSLTFIRPQGNLEINQNGSNINVSQYATVSVTVQDFIDTTKPAGEYTTFITKANPYCAAGRNAITKLNAPNLTRIDYHGFQNAGFQYLYAPNANGDNDYINHTFRDNTQLLQICLPSYTYNIYGYAAYGCTALETIDAPFKNIQGQENFRNCSNLSTIILRKSSAIVALGNVNTFYGTKFASGGAGGTIYIPKALYDHLGDGSSSDYKAATNWVTIDGYGTITWAKIEGSYYETHYADGTAVPTT